MWAFQSEKKYCLLADAGKFRSMHPAVAEIVANRFMHAVGIGAAPVVEVVESSVAIRRDPAQWIFKPIAGDRLNVAPLDKLTGRWCVAVEKIPRAVPLSFLRTRYGVDAGEAQFTPADDVMPAPFVPRWPLVRMDPERVPLSVGLVADLAGLKELIWKGKPELANAEEFFADFTLPQDTSAIKRSVRWNSYDMLAIHAARIFLGASLAHLSNVLVNSDGRLFSIDHEFCAATDGEDLRTLFNDMHPRTRAFAALRGVAELGEKKLRELFEDLAVPAGTRWFRWPLGSKEKTIDYYVNRLRYWKLRFLLAEKENAAAA
jgi:hypothetical protein